MSKNVKNTSTKAAATKGGNTKPAATKAVAPQSIFANLPEDWQGAVRVLNPNANAKEWAAQSRLNWEAVEGEATWKDKEGKSYTFNGKKVLYRSDTKAPLAYVGGDYRIVQPADLLESYAEMSRTMGIKFEAAGEFYGGRRVWALARTPHGVEIVKNDTTLGYLLFVTSFDGTVATQANFTSIRVVCLNTLNAAIRQGRANGGEFRLSHAGKFEQADAVAAIKTMDESWSAYCAQMEALAKKKVTDTQATEFFCAVAGGKYTVKDLPELRADSPVVKLVNAYKNDEVPGAAMARGTAYGLLNAVTYFADHGAKSKDAETRLKNAWTSSAKVMKDKAFAELVKLAA